MTYQLSDENTPAAFFDDFHREQAALEVSIDDWERDTKELILKNKKSLKKKMDKFRKFGGDILDTCATNKVSLISQLFSRLSSY